MEAVTVKIKPPFDIGTVYKNKDGRIFLAVSADRLFSFYGGKPHLFRPVKPHGYESVRVITVAELTARWRVTGEAFDKAVEAVTPRAPRDPYKSCVRGGRRARSREAMESDGLEIRLVRLQR